MVLKSKILVVVSMVMSCVLAAPKPIDWGEVNNKIKNFGQQALPAVRGVCGFVNSYQGYPQGFPQYPIYPQGGYQGYYPPASFYPGSQGRVPVYSNTPFNNGVLPPQGGSEQDDLNRPVNPSNLVPRPVPPQIQDVFNNIDKLPKVKVPGNALEEEQLKQYNEED